MRKSRKFISVLIMLAMLAMMMIPMATPALASATYSMSSVNSVSAGLTSTIGNLNITMDGSTAIATVNKYVYLDLPSSPTDFEFFPALTVGSTVTTGVVKTNAFAAAGSTVTITKLSKTQLGILASVNQDTTAWKPENDSMISIPMTVKVPGGVSGEIDVTASRPSSSTFADGSIAIAKVGNSSVTVASESVPSVSSSGGLIGVIDIKEGTAGALADSGGAALKIKLPSGFTWQGNPTPSYMWGNMSFDGTQNYMDYTANGDRELDIHVTNPSTVGSFIKLTGKINVDESIAKTGVVTAAISGATSSDVSSIDVANYGDYSLTVEGVDSPNITAGFEGQTIGKFQVKEGVPGSLVNQRTITLTLPSGVRWTEAPVIDSSASTATRDISVVWTAVGTDGRMIKGTISCDKLGAPVGTSDPAVVVFKNAEVTPEVDFSGDLAIAVAGSEGTTGTITLGKVAAGVTMTTSATPDVKIGLASQDAGDVTITEAAAESIDSRVTCSKLNADGTVDSDSTGNSGSQAQIKLTAPAGVTFSSTPTVEVTSGDIQLDTNSIKTDTSDANEGLLYINIKSTSSTASTIKISNIKLTVDRTVPQGPITFKLKGDAVNETLDNAGNDTVFPGSTTAAKADVANCVTGISDQNTSNVSFKIGDTKFTVNGADNTMDVAPYIKDGRTYLPVRYVAQALGVSDSNILWDSATNKVTVIKGDKVVQMTIGNKTMLVNGVGITMDAAPELTSGRTMLPFRFVAQAFGASVNWDDATQTVTMNLN